MSEHGRYLGVEDGRSRTGPIPARRPVDDALDSLDAVIVQYERAMHELGWTMVNVRARDAVATVREALERQRDELDELRAAFGNAEYFVADSKRRAEAAEAEVRQLRDETRTEREHRLLNETRRLEIERDAAEASVRRLTEEAQRGQEPLAHLILDATTIRQAHKIARAALLSASPSDGGGA